MTSQTPTGSGRWMAQPCSPQFSDMLALMHAANDINRHTNTSPNELALPEAIPPASMRLSILPTGVIESKAGLAFSGGKFSEIRRFALNAVLVQHPHGDLIIDTGIGKNWQAHRQLLPWLMQKTTKIKAGVPAAEQLVQGQYDFSKLSGIVLTHAHWDHISGVADFPPVPVWITQEEDRFIKSKHRSTAVANSLLAPCYKTYAFEHGPYLGFDQSYDVWGDGAVVLVPAPGHTPGSIIVFVTVPSGRRFAFIGDIVWQMEGLENEVPKPWLSRLIADFSPDEVLRLIVKLSHIYRTRREIEFLPAHDERAMSGLAQWPDFLD